jgi:hypothetical protein
MASYKPGKMPPIHVWEEGDEPLPPTAKRMTEAADSVGLAHTTARKKIAKGLVRAVVFGGAIYVLEPAELRLQRPQGAAGPNVPKYPWKKKLPEKKPRKQRA